MASETDLDRARDSVSHACDHLRAAHGMECIFPSDMPFDSAISTLDAALDELAALRAQVVRMDALLFELQANYLHPIMRVAMGGNTLEELDGFEHYYARRCQEAIAKIVALRTSSQQNGGDDGKH